MEQKKPSATVNEFPFFYHEYNYAFNSNNNHMAKKV